MILPEYRNNKIGTKLLQDCFERARKLGAEKIKIGIVEENTVLRAWYERYVSMSLIIWMKILFELARQ